MNEIKTSMNKVSKVAIAYGDGIGPEIMESTLEILNAAQARLSFETVEIGEKLYNAGYSSGIGADTWDIIKGSDAFLKAPITTPQGKGYKSLNVTTRKALGLYANVRPVRSLYPYVNTKQEKFDVVVIRENEEDIYAGIEYRYSRDACHSLKIISKAGSAKIIKYAFEYALRNNRKKVTCFVKDNIMKLTDGLFSSVFNEIAKFYPEIESEIYIVDIGSARLAAKPYLFDVIVTENLYGDIISDIIAEVGGSVGLAGSSNIGNQYAMFEAIHGSAPRLVGQNRANPLGLLNGALLMLQHLDQHDIAEKIDNAVLRTIEDGVHTPDLCNEKYTTQKVNTKEFTREIINRLGEKPNKLAKPSSQIADKSQLNLNREINIDHLCNEKHKELVGVDISFDYNGNNVNDFVKLIQNVTSDQALTVQGVVTRGLSIWPDKGFEYDIIGILTVRFVSNRPDPNKLVTIAEIVKLINSLVDADIEHVKTDNLYVYDGTLGFSLSQAE